MTQLNFINLKNAFVYEIGLIAIREVSPPFDEEQQYWRPYQPKHSPSLPYFVGPFNLWVPYVSVGFVASLREWFIINIPYYLVSFLPRYLFFPLE